MRSSSTGFRNPAELPKWLTQHDLDFFVAEFERTGFRGGLNWYRNMDRNWELTPQLADAKVSQPALFITGDRDPVMSFTSAEAMTPYVPNLTSLSIPGVGHWTQQEAPDSVNEALIAFLKGL